MNSSVDFSNWFFIFEGVVRVQKPIVPWTHHYLLLPLVLLYDYESHHQLIHQNSKFVFLIRSETNHSEISKNLRRNPNILECGFFFGCSFIGCGIGWRIISWLNLGLEAGGGIGRNHPATVLNSLLARILSTRRSSLIDLGLARPHTHFSSTQPNCV